MLKSIPVRSIEEAVSVIELATSHESTDYVDGIVYGPECGIIFEGRLVDTIATPLPSGHSHGLKTHDFTSMPKTR